VRALLRPGGIELEVPDAFVSEPALVRVRAFARACECTGAGGAGSSRADRDNGHRQLNRLGFSPAVAALPCPWAWPAPFTQVAIACTMPLRGKRVHDHQTDSAVRQP